MKVLRIQNKEGCGCYVDVDDDLYDVLDGYNEIEPPTPLNDEGINRYPYYMEEYCGFLNEAQLLNWFDDDSKFDVLSQYGYAVVEIEAEITAIGKRQVLFKRIDNERV